MSNSSHNHAWIIDHYAKDGLDGSEFRLAGYYVCPGVVTIISGTQCSFSILISLLATAFTSLSVGRE